MEFQRRKGLALAIWGNLCQNEKVGSKLAQRRGRRPSTLKGEEPNT